MKNPLASKGVKPSEEKTAEAVPAVVKVVAEKKARIMPTATTITEPNPKGKKGQVIEAGRQDGGSSIKDLATAMNCTESNIRQHITQANTNLGYGFEILGDNFKITGDPTESWADQTEKKAKVEADKKAEAEAVAEAKKAEEA